MGCDIHAYLQYAPKEPRSPDDWPRADSFAKLSIGRDYALFALMAGVRDHSGFGPVVEPRGVPMPLSYQIDGDYFTFVSPAGKEETDDTVSQERAEGWVASGASKWREDMDKDPNVQKRTWVTGPDWHTPSWLTSAEFAQVVSRYFDLCQKEYAESHGDDKHNKFVEYMDKIAADIGKTLEEKAQIKANVERLTKKPTFDSMYGGTLSEIGCILAAMNAAEFLGKPMQLVFFFDN